MLSTIITIGAYILYILGIVLALSLEGLWWIGAIVIAFGVCVNFFAKHLDNQAVIIAQNNQIIATLDYIAQSNNNNNKGED